MVFLTSGIQSSQIKYMGQFPASILFRASFIQVQKLSYHPALFPGHGLFLFMDMVFICFDVEVFHTLFLLRLFKGNLRLHGMHLVHHRRLGDFCILSQYLCSPAVTAPCCLHKHSRLCGATQSLMGIQPQPFIQ